MRKRVNYGLGFLEVVPVARVAGILAACFRSYSLAVRPPVPQLSRPRLQPRPSRESLKAPNQ